MWKNMYLSQALDTRKSKVLNTGKCNFLKFVGFVFCFLSHKSLLNLRLQKKEKEKEI